MAARAFEVVEITTSEKNEKLVKFQLKSEKTHTDEIGTKIIKSQETYYRWYNSLAKPDDQLVNTIVNLDIDRYDVVEKLYEVNGKTMTLKYLLDRK